MACRMPASSSQSRLLVPVKHWSAQFQPDGQAVLKVHDGKFGAAKDRCKIVLWRRRLHPLVQVDRRSDADDNADQQPGV